MLTGISTLRGAHMAGSITDVLDSIESIGKYMTTVASGLTPFTGQKTVGWEEANKFARPAADSMETTLVNELTAVQLNTMASELPAKAKSLITALGAHVAADDYAAQITRYLTAIDTEVPNQDNVPARICYTIWLYLMANLEYMTLSTGLADEAALVTAKIKTCLNDLVTSYLSAKGWVGSTLASFFSGSNLYIALAVAALGIGILRSSKHTKVGS